MSMFKRLTLWIRTWVMERKRSHQSRAFSFGYAHEDGTVEEFTSTTFRDAERRRDMGAKA